jgi:hypothetical protein
VPSAKRVRVAAESFVFGMTNTYDETSYVVNMRVAEFVEFGPGLAPGA